MKEEDGKCSEAESSWPIIERNEPNKLQFPTQVNNANHTYNGVSFHVRSKSLTAVIRVESFWVGGDLGQVTIWASSAYGFNPTSPPVGEDWINVAAGEYEPCWTDSTEIKLLKPVDINPGATMGFYIHSAVNNDNGIAYNSHSGLVCEDKNTSVWAGFGHTSSDAFSMDHGWSWRRNRGPSGAMSYSQVFTLWCPRTHSKFPPSFKKVVFCLLAIHSKRPLSLLSQLPLDVLYNVLEYCHLQWFEDDETLARKLAAQEEQEKNVHRQATSSYTYDMDYYGW